MNAPMAAFLAKYTDRLLNTTARASRTSPSTNSTSAHTPK